MTEIRDVIGYEGYYKVQNDGVVISIKTGSPMKTYMLNSGYQAIKLTKDRKRQAFQLHRLVAINFCDGYADGLVVNHIDGNRMNNSASNLEWCTYKENSLNQMDRGTLNVTTAQEVAWVKNQRAVIITTPTGEELEFPSLKQACEELGLTSGKVCDVCNGRRDHHKQHKARYKHQVG